MPAELYATPLGSSVAHLMAADRTWCGKGTAGWRLHVKDAQGVLRGRGGVRLAVCGSCLRIAAANEAPEV